MSGPAVFEATFAGFRSLTDGDYRISFDFPGEKLEHVVAVLAQGGKPSAARGTWFAIARLSEQKGVGVSVAHRTTPGDRESSEEGIFSAPGPVTKTPGRSLSQYLHKKLCTNPIGRKYCEETMQDVLLGEQVNNAETAHSAIVKRLGIVSLSEVDSDPIASGRAEELLKWFACWERGLETPRIQQANEA